MPFVTPSSPPRPVPAALCGALLLAACGDDGGSGDMNPPQESVSDGVDDLKANIEVAVKAGVGVFGLGPSAGVVDGWTVSFDRLLVTVGTVSFTDQNGFVTAHQEDAVLDLLQLASPSALASITFTPGSQKVRFSVPDATDRFVAFESTAAADRDLMAANGWSLLVEGRIDNPAGMTCTADKVPLCTPAPSVAFRWGLAAGTAFSGCPDVVVDPGDELAATIELSADRLFYPGFADDDASAPTLRAQWLADADLDRDGETTLDELGSIKASALFPRSRGYDFLGAPIGVATARDFVEAQARSLGRRALGLCPTSTRL
jgi:hypothetical protein